MRGNGRAVDGLDFAVTKSNLEEMKRLFAAGPPASCTHHPGSNSFPRPEGAPRALPGWGEHSWLGGEARSPFPQTDSLAAGTRGVCPGPSEQWGRPSREIHWGEEMS